MTQEPRNAASCAECHEAPFEGGCSRITATRIGRRVGGKYIGLGIGGTFHAQGETSIATDNYIKGPRVVLNTLGDGYVEAFLKKTCGG